ncbi:MAG: hypothetical protein NE334_10815 [Lentisphaeraceae bacterium]|nr:hypothetical protein [Lentisphaeraceae bacterium]
MTSRHITLIEDFLEDVSTEKDLRKIKKLIQEDSAFREYFTDAFHFNRLLEITHRKDSNSLL